LAPQPRFRFLPTMGLLLLLGFGGTTALIYFSARGTLNRQLTNSTLPLTAKAIKADLERTLTQPVLVSLSMARNTFLLRWLADGEREPAEMVAYLSDLRHQFRATTAFFVSDRSGRYYHPDGVLKTVSPKDPVDRWYYRLRDTATPFEVNIDRDTANPDRVTAFSNFRVQDRQGRFIGAIGLGIDVRELERELTVHQQRHGAQVLLVARDGQVLLAPAGSGSLELPARLQEVPGLAPHAARLLRDAQVSLRFRHGQGQLFVNSRQIPELGWVMVVLQQTDPLQDALLPILWRNLLIALLVSGVVLLLANATVGSYQRRLQLQASTDKLTGLLNRTAFDRLFADLVQVANRRKQPLAVLLLDIDFFKAINDTHGHAVGDQVIQHVAARLARASSSGEQVFRWGGEEFLILMPGCGAARAVEWGEALRRALRLEPVPLSAGSGPDGPSNTLLAPTISCGVTSYQLGETDQELLLRADQALYRAKHEGRDRVVCLDQGEEAVARSAASA
jgi:diguanylate cyclase (GGDEF)-like protein